MYMYIYIYFKPTINMFCTVWNGERSCGRAVSGSKWASVFFSAQFNREHRPEFDAKVIAVNHFVRHFAKRFHLVFGHLYKDSR